MFRVYYPYLFTILSLDILRTLLFGAIIDLLKSYSGLFWYAGIASLCAFVCMFFARHGEAERTSKA